MRKWYIGIFVLILVLVGYSYYSVKKKQQEEKQSNINNHLQAIDTEHLSKTVNTNIGGK